VGNFKGVYCSPYSGTAQPLAAPLGFYAHPQISLPRPKRCDPNAGESARTTHGAAECIDSCRLFGAILDKLYPMLSRIHSPGTRSDCSGQLSPQIGDDNREIRLRGSQGLEAVLWCFLNTDTFVDGVLQEGCNLVDDADTTSAVCRQLAGVTMANMANPEFCALGWNGL